MLNSKAENRTGVDAGHGFTLLEVLVALSIIAIVMVSVMRLQGQSIFLNETTRFYSIAPFLAQAKMADVRYDPSAFIGGGSGEFEDDFPGYKWAVEIEEKEIGLEGKSVMGLDAVTVTVTRESSGLKYALTDFFQTGDST